MHAIGIDLIKTRDIFKDGVDRNALDCGLYKKKFLFFFSNSSCKTNSRK